MELTELEKIAKALDEELGGFSKQANPNGVSEGYQPATGMEPSGTNQNFADELQGAQEPVGTLTEEELALQQQLSLEQQQEMMMQEQAKEAERSQVDRALLEGAATEAIQEMEDDELRDILIDKAASELIGLSSFAYLIDQSTCGEDTKITKEASDILNYMSVSSENFNDGLQKVASVLFDDEESINHAFSHDGVNYVFEQLAKLEDFNALEKVASTVNTDALYKIASNEGEELSMVVDHLADAYTSGVKDAIKAVQKDEIMDKLEKSEDEGEEDEMNEQEQLANELLEAWEKTAAPKIPAAVHDRVYQAKRAGRNAVNGAKYKLSNHKHRAKVKSGEYIDKAKRTGNEYVEKAKDLPGTLKSNYNQAQAEQKVKNRFAELGKDINSAKKSQISAKRKDKRKENAKSNMIKGGLGVAGVGAVGAGGRMVYNKRTKGNEPVNNYESREEEQLANELLYAWEKTAGNNSFFR